jgi:hypothetical protein
MRLAMKPVRSVCVFCGSSRAVAEVHRRNAEALGEGLAARGIRIVYGGGRIGLMGLLADAALRAGGEVVGVIPEFLFELEVAHTGLTELRRVGGMHERKWLMSDLADAFVALSGGLGTVEETIEIITWKQLALHDKPIVILNVEGLWDSFLAHIDRLIETGFAHPDHARLFTLVDAVPRVLTALESAEAPSLPPDLKWT